jgi:hypothetical protein
MLAGVCSPLQRVTNVSRNGRGSGPRGTSHHLELDQDSGVQHSMTTPKQLVNNAGHWKARADEARRLADAEPDARAAARRIPSSRVRMARGDQSTGPTYPNSPSTPLRRVSFRTRHARNFELSAGCPVRITLAENDDGLSGRLG